MIDNFFSYDSRLQRHPTTALDCADTPSPQSRCGLLWRPCLRVLPVSLSPGHESRSAPMRLLCLVALRTECRVEAANEESAGAGNTARRFESRADRQGKYVKSYVDAGFAVMLIARRSVEYLVRGVPSNSL